MTFAPPSRRLLAQLALGVLTCSAMLCCFVAPSRAEESSQTSFDRQLDGWLAQLESTNADDRRAAMRRIVVLPPWRLNAARSARLLRAAGKKFPEQDDGTDLAATLIEVVATRPRADHIDVIKSVFPQYASRARGEAMRLLSEIGSVGAAEAVVSLVDQYAAAGTLPTFTSYSWSYQPDLIGTFYPKLLKYLESPLEIEILELLLTHCEREDRNAAVIESCQAGIVARYQAHKRKLFPLQKPGPMTWIWNDDYRKRRDATVLLLQLLVQVGGKEAGVELTRSLAFRDPLLKMHAAIALTRGGVKVEPSVWEEIAASAETRSQLFDLLTEHEQPELFPAKRLRQLELAESDMVQFLAYDSSLNQPPDEMELVKVVSIDTQSESGTIDYYVYRFRMLPPHAMAEKQWMAGVAGPYERADQPTTGYAESNFESIEAKSPEDHIGNLNEILDTYRSGEEP